MSKRPPPQPDSALYVRLPANAVAKLSRAAEALGVHKKDLIAGLVSKYVDPDSKRGLSALGAYSFQPYDPPEVMNAEQAGQLLQLDEKIVLELAESGQLPGRKLGNQWRFSRAAVIAWLSGEGERPDRSRR